MWLAAPKLGRHLINAAVLTRVSSRLAVAVRAGARATESGGPLFTAALPVPACFVSVSAAAADRFLFIKIDARRVRKADWDVMGSIGHELRHTIEVIGERSVDCETVYAIPALGQLTRVAYRLAVATRGGAMATESGGPLFTAGFVQRIVPRRLSVAVAGCDNVIE